MVKNANKIIFYNMLSTLLIVGVSFFSAPLFSRILGTDNYGIVSVYNTWVNLAVIIFPLQVGNGIPVAKIEYPASKQKEYQSSILLLILLLYVLFSIPTFFLAFIIGVDRTFLLPGLLHGLGMYCVSYFNSKCIYEFDANKNLKLAVIISLLNIGLSLIFIFMIPKDIGYFGRIYGLAIAYILAGSFVIGYFIKQYPLTFRKDYWIFTLQITFPTVFHQLAYTLLNQCDRLMLQGMQGNHVVGVYSLAASFATVLTTIYEAMNKSWVAFYYEYIKKGEIKQLRIKSKNYIEVFSIITLGFILLSKEIFHIFASKEYWDGTIYVPVFAIGTYAVFLYSFAFHFEFYHKKTKKIALGTSLAALINILLNYILILKIDAVGAVIATMVAHIFQFVFHYICARTIKETIFPYKIMDFIPWFIIIMAVGIICSVVDGMMIVRWSTGFLLGIYMLYKVIKRKSIW